MLMELQNKDDITLKYAQTDLDTAVRLISTTQRTDADPKELNTRYETEKMGFEFRTQNKPEKEYLLGNKQFLAKEYPKREYPNGGNATSSAQDANRKILFDTKG